MLVHERLVEARIQSLLSQRINKNYMCIGILIATSYLGFDKLITGEKKSKCPPKRAVL